MKVGMYYSNSDVRAEEMKRPIISDDEILMKVVSSGICGSDVMEWYRIKKAPLVLGHEVSGVVEEAGDSVDGFSRGDRIVVTHHVSCGDCRYCNDGNETMCETLRKTKFYPGGFSQYLRIPAINVSRGTLKLPDNVSFDEATFVEPLGCVVRSQRIAGIRKNHTVLVIGSGISGLLHIKLAKSRGAKVFATDISEKRMLAAEAAGADFVFSVNDDISSKLTEKNGRLADRVIVCTGAFPAFTQALSCAERGGKVLFFASTKPDAEVPVKVEHLWKNGICIVTSYAASKKDLQEAMEIIGKGEVEVASMITDRLPISQIQRGFDLMTGDNDSVKIIIRPND